MVESLISIAKHKRWLALLCIITAVPFAVAENLPDPTRPPASLGLQGSDQSIASSTPQLQSVLISPRRKLAIISGKSVRVGEKFGAAQVVKISEKEVVLRTGDDYQTLKLFPHLEKRISSHSKPKASARGNKVKEQ